MKVFLITRFPIETEDDLPGEMVMDDVIDALRDDSTIVETDPVRARNKANERGRLLFSVTVERN